MARTSNSGENADQAETTADGAEAPAPAPGGHHVAAGAPVGEPGDISKVAGASEDGPIVVHPAPMFWMRSELTGNVYPAFNLGQREELANNGCEELPLDQGPDGMPTATGMAGTGLLA